MALVETVGVESGGLSSVVEEMGEAGGGEGVEVGGVAILKKNWKRTLVSEALIPYNVLKTLIKLMQIVLLSISFSTLFIEKVCTWGKTK